jgi:NAD(P)-dependent dehydrogenase (short-subunit alcohol dehydrogenase family)
MDLGLKGKRAVVTGGSRGIGLAIVEALSAEGADVAIVARDAARAQEAASAVSARTGNRVIVSCADTGDDASVAAMGRDVAERLGPVDILVNCAAEPAGQGKTPLAEEVTRDMLDRQMNVKVMGYLRAAQAVLPGMRRNGWGRIISISGMGARKAGDTVGSIRNVAVVAMSKNLAEELAGTGITSVVVHPGFTKTDKVEAMIAARSEETGQSPEDIEAGLASGNLNGYLPTPEDIGAIVAFLASEKARAINGDVIAAAGGARVAIHY